MSFPYSRIAPVLLAACAVSPILPQGPGAPSAALSSPVGQWKTIDDATGKAKSVVDIREESGKLSGRIVEIFNPPVPRPTCYLCTGALKDRPLMGLQILWGFTWDGARWSGGQVLDPETGKIYRASLLLAAGGAKLRLHGYIGFPLLGRTQYWLRLE
jgi:uncharacterized protein (DUF2147 family)